jgi:hypothetical protein
MTRYLLQVVLGGSEAGDERDAASSLGIAEARVLAGVAPIHRLCLRCLSPRAAYS